MKKRLIILSDLWGASKNDWIDYYFNSLESNFDITYYDCCELGAVDKTIVVKEELHEQFVNYGITTAVKKLIALEPNEIDVLAFSIGGTIAWKAALRGLKINKMYAISATRLRHELNKPACEINLIYGEYDPFKPSIKWFKKMGVDYSIIKSFGHETYRDSKNVFSFCAEINKKINTSIF